MLFELWELLQCPNIPVFLLDELEVCRRDVLWTAHEKRTLFLQQFTSSPPIGHNTILFVKLRVEVLDALSNDVTADDKLLFQEA